MTYNSLDERYITVLSHRIVLQEEAGVQQTLISVVTLFYYLHHHLYAVLSFQVFIHWIDGISDQFLPGKRPSETSEGQKN